MASVSVIGDRLHNEVEALPRNERLQVMLRFHLRPGSLVAIAFSLVLLFGSTISGQEKIDGEVAPQEEKLVAADGTNEAAWIADLVEASRKSIVEIAYLGRDGKPAGVGTGFIISADGLIASNLHVIGEARKIIVKTSDGEQPKVIEVFASDPKLDLAIIRVDARDLTALKVADSSELRNGESVIAIGNPHGLRESVVSGVLSGKREIDGRQMLQLAMPIEPGNSGGPVLNRKGEVVGVVTMKSLITDNLGFAMDSNMIRQLMEKPNPIAMERWLTIGALDAKKWKLLGDATWRQQGGRIVAEGASDGLAGRSLCLSKTLPPDLPFEVSVEVKLADETGAAGLVFNSDGIDGHYGFYPSNREMRFTRFAGATVFQWQVLHQQSSEHYRTGEWNRLKVRLDKDGKFTCYVNDELVVTLVDTAIKPGLVGFAKFRETHAEFRNFKVAESIPDQRPSETVVTEIRSQIEKLPQLAKSNGELAPALLDNSEASIDLLEEQAKQLEQRANELRKVGQDLQMQKTLHALADAYKKIDEQPIGMIRACLLIAKLDEPEVDVDSYLNRLDEMAKELKSTLPADASVDEKVKKLNDFLFVQYGFHGSRTNYYTRENSYLHRVLDDREGLPLTLAIVYCQLAQTIGLNMNGVSLPGHFIARLELENNQSRLIDVFEGGAELPLEKAKEMAIASTGIWDDDFITVATRQAILTRLISNLRGIAERERDSAGLLRYAEAMLVIEPDSISHRGVRAVMRFETGRKQAGIADLDWIIEQQPTNLDLDQIYEMRAMFQRSLDSER